MPKALFFDVDGTLNSRDGHGNSFIPSSAIEAIRKTRSLGNLCFLSTGRSIPEITRDLFDIGFDGYVSGAGNCLIYKDEIIYEKHMAIEDARKILSDFDKYKVAYVVEGNNAVYISDEQYKQFKHEKGFNFLNIVSKVSPIINYDDINKISFNAEAEVFELMRKKYEKDFYFVASSYMRENRYHAEISTKGISKGSTISYLLDYLHIDSRDSYAFGDSDNDIEMFETCGTAIAMGEHSKAVEPHVDYITARVEDDGLKKAMEHFGLI